MTSISRLSALLVVVVLLGCATPKEYTPPPKAALQDALPGKALVYFLRAPDDADTLSLKIDEGTILVLPGSRYTAQSVEPGKYVVKTSIVGAKADEKSRAIPELKITIGEHERLCFFLPAPERRNVQTFGSVPLPIVVRKMQETGAQREWTSAGDDETNWFIHYTRVYVE